MKNNREKTFAYIHLIIFILSVITDWYRILILLSFLLLIVMLLDKMGRGIVLREIIALHSSFVCLLMPLCGYLFFTKDFLLARVWVKYMLIPEEVYFGFACPAIIGFIVFLSWPLTGSKDSDGGPGLKAVLDRSRDVLRQIPKTGVFLMVTGVFSLSVNALLPSVLQFAFYLFFFAAFSGMLYVYYCPGFKRKGWVIGGFAMIIFLNALQSGMFTIIAYMSITLISFFFFGKQYAFIKKLGFFVVGLMLVFLLQNVKHGFRAKTWASAYEGNKLTLFISLVGEQFTSRKEEPVLDAFFPMYVRGNQGFNVTMVMRRIPQEQEFDNGKNLFISFVSSFVPRVFWPDKPEAGGKFNMAYYAGYSIDGWSTNVGPLGEAYGSFGVTGGIIFMIVLGVAIRWIYSIVFRIGYKIPLLLFWIPMIFYQITYSAEADTLQITNSIIKSAIFVWGLYRVWPILFGVVKNKFGSSRTSLQQLNRVPVGR